MAKVPIALCYSPFQYHWVVRALFGFFWGGGCDFQGVNSMSFLSLPLSLSLHCIMQKPGRLKASGIDKGWMEGAEKTTGDSTQSPRKHRKKTFHYSDWFINITFSSWALWVWYSIIIFPKLKPVYDPNNQALTKLALQHSLDKVSKHPNIVENVKNKKQKNHCATCGRPQTIIHWWFLWG